MNDGTRLPAMSGKCLCGSVSFTANPATAMHVCHCEACRRTSGGAWIGVDCGDSVEARGEVTWYASSDWAERGFCPKCGASLFWRLREGGMELASIQAFDDPTAFTLADELFVEEKPGNYALAGDHPRLTGAEFMAQMNGEG